MVVDAVEDCEAGGAHPAGEIGFDDGGFLFGGLAKATEAVGFHDGFVHSCHNRQTMTAVMGLRDNHRMVVGTTLTNKLLHIIYGVLKHQKPFDPEYLKKHGKIA